MNEPSELENIENQKESPPKTAQVSMTYSGPLPPPSVIEGYERILPGSADRILTMAEVQGEHRRRIESQESRANIVTVRIGAVFALIITIFTIGAGTYLISIDKGAGGLAIIIAELVALASVFIIGRRVREKKKDSRE